MAITRGSLNVINLPLTEYSIGFISLFLVLIFYADHLSAIRFGHFTMQRYLFKEDEGLRHSLAEFTSQITNRSDLYQGTADKKYRRKGDAESSGRHQG